ncbi:type VI secretion system Vgr family domain protein [Escherichia coli]
MSTGLRSHWKWTACRRMLFAVVSFSSEPVTLFALSLNLSLVSQQFLSLEFAQVLDKNGLPDDMAGR